MRGCMNCGNISCGNNKKRDCAGCGRWISPEDKIAELEEKVVEYNNELERTRKTALLNLDSWRKSEANLRKAKEIIKNLLILHNDTFGKTDLDWRCMVVAEAEKFPMECPDAE